MPSNGDARAPSAGMHGRIGEQPPAITIPMSLGWMPARSIAISARAAHLPRCYKAPPPATPADVSVLSAYRIVEREDGAAALDADPIR
jgi:hypothetical protein